MTLLKHAAPRRKDDLIILRRIRRVEELGFRRRFYWSAPFTVLVHRIETKTVEARR
jgi:hypothetical protein